MGNTNGEQGPPSAFERLQHLLRGCSLGCATFVAILVGAYVLRWVIRVIIPPLLRQDMFRELVMSGYDPYDTLLFAMTGAILAVVIWFVVKIAGRT